MTPETLFNDEQGYGYDLQPAWDGKSNQPFFFSVNVPDGNYKVTVTLGSKDSAGNTTVRAESRRLFIENLPTKRRNDYRIFYCQQAEHENQRKRESQNQGT